MKRGRQEVTLKKYYTSPVSDIVLEYLDQQKRWTRGLMTAVLNQIKISRRENHHTLKKMLKVNNDHLKISNQWRFTAALRELRYRSGITKKVPDRYRPDLQPLRCFGYCRSDDNYVYLKNAHIEISRKKEYGINIKSRPLINYNVNDPPESIFIGMKDKYNYKLLYGDKYRFSWNRYWE
jgi:hypothetical protein